MNGVDRLIKQTGLSKTATAQLLKLSRMSLYNYKKGRMSKHIKQYIRAVSYIFNQVGLEELKKILDGEYDNLTRWKMDLENQELLKKANKEIEKEYLREIRAKLSLFPCFFQRDLYIYSVKLWNDAKEYRLPKNILFDKLIYSIEKSIKYARNLGKFEVYRYILKVFQNNLDKEEILDEGDIL